MIPSRNSSTAASLSWEYLPGKGFQPVDLVMSVADLDIHRVMDFARERSTIDSKKHLMNEDCPEQSKGQGLQWMSRALRRFNLSTSSGSLRDSISCCSSSSLCYHSESYPSRKSNTRGRRLEASKIGFDGAGVWIGSASFSRSRAQ